jgi:hypothetical protein
MSNWIMVMADRNFGHAGALVPCTPPMAAPFGGAVDPRGVEGELWEHKETSCSRRYEAIVLRDVQEDELRVIAELAEVLG